MIRLLSAFFLAISALCAQGLPAGARKATANELTMFTASLERYDFMAAPMVATKLEPRAITVAVTPTSHFAVTAIGGPAWSAEANITATVHTAVPAGSLIGLRVRYWEGDRLATRVEGVGYYDQELDRGYNLLVKAPGGRLLFDGTREYQIIVVDSRSLSTTVDYVPVFDGFADGITETPTITVSSKGNFLKIPVRSSAIDAVVLGGFPVFVSALSFDSITKSAVVDLGALSFCLWPGDLTVTVVIGGKSDTTQIRVPQGVPQSCRSKG